MSLFMAHFAHSLRCGDRVRLQDYFCRAGEAPGRRTIDPQETSQVYVPCDAAIAAALGAGYPCWAQQGFAAR